MKDCVRFLGVLLQHLDGFCRRQHNQFNPTIVGLTLNIVHDRQTAMRAGADQARAFPWNVFFHGQRRMAKRLAELLWTPVSSVGESHLDR